MKDIGKKLLVYLMGFVMARAVFFGINPLAIGFFTAAYLDKAGGGLLFLTVLAGIWSAMPPTMVLKYLLTMITAVVAFEAPLIKRRNISPKVLFAIPAVALGIFAMMESAAYGWKTDYTVLAVLEGFVAYVAGITFRKGTGFLLNQAKGERMNNEQMVSLAFMVAVIIYAVPEYRGRYFAPVETIVFFVILLFTYKYGVGQGTVAGAVSGFVLSLRGASYPGIGILTMMGIIPAIFRGMGRIPVAAVFALTAAIISMVFEEMALSVREIGAMSSAILLFLLLPKSLIYRIEHDNASGSPELLASSNLKKIANSRMKIFSDSFLKLSKTLDTITERQNRIKNQEINGIFEDISEKLCKNCRNCSLCWEQNFKETYQAACAMFDTAEKNGYVGKEDIPVYFLDTCICADQFILETNRGFEIAKLNGIWRSRLAESREVIAGQLREVSSVIHTMTGDIYQTARVMQSDEEKIIKKLRAGHIHVKDITIMERSDKRKEIFLSAAAGRNRCITAREAAGMISEALGLKFKVSEASKSVLSKEYEDFAFIEDTKFKVLTGVARAMKDQISGDNFSILKLDTGEELIALSDGMGTGKEAGEESETVLSLLEQLLEAGFKAETAVKLINSSLVLKAERQTFSTIDMGIINLFTGICEFVKIGAASAFIKRDNWVETISSTTLPIGMFGNVDYDSASKKLYEGNIVIMVTDGVLDCIREEDKEAYMEHLIMDIKSNNPQEIANRILDHALSQSNYEPMDDMTVITAGIWLK